MSTENNEQLVPIPEGTKALKIKVDGSPQLAAKDLEISRLNQKIGEHEGTIKAMLKDHQREFVPNIEPKMPPKSDPQDTAQLNEPKRQTSAPIELDVDCPIPLSAKGENAEQIIDFLKLNAEKGNRDAEHILDKLIRKELKKNGTYEFQGNMTPTFMHNGKLVKVERAKNNHYLKYSGSFKNVDED